MREGWKERERNGERLDETRMRKPKVREKARGLPFERRSTPNHPCRTSSPTPWWLIWRESALRSVRVSVRSKDALAPLPGGYRVVAYSGVWVSIDPAWRHLTPRNPLDMLLATPSLSWVPIVPPPQRAAFVPARSSTPTPSQPTYVRPNFSPPLSPAPPLRAYSFSFCRACQFFLHHPLFLRCAVVRSSPSVFWSLCSHLRSLIIVLNVLRFAHSDFSYLYSVSSSLRYFRVFQWSCLRLFVRTRLYTQNRLPVSLSFAHLAVLQPLVSVFPLSLFPSPIILLFLFTPPLLSPLFLPSILFYFFFLYQSLFLPFALFSLLSLSLSFPFLSLFHFSTLFIVVPRIFLDLLPCSDRCRVFLQATLFMPVSSRICLTIFFVSRCPSPFLHCFLLALSASSRKIIIYLLFPKCVWNGFSSVLLTSYYSCWRSIYRCQRSCGFPFDLTTTTTTMMTAIFLCLFFFHSRTDFCNLWEWISLWILWFVLYPLLLPPFSMRQSDRSFLPQSRLISACISSCYSASLFLFFLIFLLFLILFAAAFATFFVISEVNSVHFVVRHFVIVILDYHVILYYLS